MARRLAWVPKESLESLGQIPDSIEVTAWPDEPLQDPRLYELLALVDAIRDGRSREREIAVRELTSRIDLEP